MSAKKRKIGIAIWACVVLVLLVVSILTGNAGGEQESIKEVMRDAVLHETGKIEFLGILEVNPAVISGFQPGTLRISVIVHTGNINAEIRYTVIASGALV